MRGLMPAARDRIKPGGATAKGRGPKSQSHGSARVTARKTKWRRVRKGLVYWAMISVTIAGLGYLSDRYFMQVSVVVATSIEAARQWVQQESARAGFSFERVEVTGLNRTSRDTFLATLGMVRETPLLAINIEQARVRLMGLPWISDVDLARSFPDALRVRVTEREPTVLWQIGGTHHVLDDQGRVIPTIEGKDFLHLPMVIGPGAPQAIGEFRVLQEKLAILPNDLSAAVRVSDRRWRLHLDGRISVELPETDPAGALDRLIAEDTKHQLLARAVQTVDLRLPDRLIVRLQPGSVPSVQPLVPGEDA